MEAKTDTKQPEEMVKVRCKRDVWWGPAPHLHKLYREGEELVIPRSRFTDWHKQDTITGENGKTVTVRGSFELASLPAKSPDELLEQNDKINALYAENQKLLARLAELQDSKPERDAQEKRTPGKQSGKKDEI